MYGVIEFGGIGTGAEVENKIDGRLFFLHPAEEIFPFHPHDVFFMEQVQFFFFVVELVHEDEFFESLPVEVAHHAASDEAGGAGDDDG